MNLLFSRSGSRVSLVAALSFVALLLGCGGTNNAPTGSGPGGGPAAGPGATSTGATASNGTASTSGSGGAGGAFNGVCPVTIQFQPGYVVSNVRVAGEWQGFDLGSAPAMTGPTVDGIYSATVQMTPGLQAYKVVYDDVNGGGTQWVLNPSEGRRKYVSGVENSAVKVRDCSLPTLTVQTTSSTRPTAGQGHYQATLSYVDGIDGSGAAPAGLDAQLVEDETSTPLASPQVVSDASGNVTVDVSGLADGKYRVVLRPKTVSGKVGEPVLLVFWIEAEAFSWKDALIYMVMTDRFRDGDPTNNAPPTSGADPRGDYKGGDLQGVTAAINDGTFDALGVRALWLSPFLTNPQGAFAASDGVHQVTGYHGYWPIKAREVDPRLGGPDALHALVKAAHAHGVRILQDFVLNQVHQEHEYVAAHPEWFRTGCVCGTQNCDWDSHAVDCMFAPYLPDVNYTVPEVTAQFASDAVYWLNDFDIDGLRIDAVKHVEEAATRNLAAEVRETFEGGGTHYFLMGETAMGWNNCADPCNDDNYNTISKYIGPLGLDGQFDFVLYHGVSYNTFAYGDKGMIHADYWMQHNLSKWPAGAIMTPFIGSHDTARIATLSDYRGQDAAHDRGIPGNQWDNIASAPSDPEPYRRARIGMSWLLGLPGAPLMYYGDEYGAWGGSDPNNRTMWRPSAQLDADEAATLAFVKKLGLARKNVPAMRRGDYVTLFTSEDTLVFGRKIPNGDAALVALTRLNTVQPVTVEVEAALGWLPSTQVQDALGGPNATVSPSGMLSFNVPASSSVVLHP